MSYEIIEIGPTESGKWKVRVVISPDESVFFKFNEYPTQERVDIEAEIYVLTNKAAQLRIKAEAMRNADSE